MSSLFQKIRQSIVNSKEWKKHEQKKKYLSNYYRQRRDELLENLRKIRKENPNVALKWYRNNKEKHRFIVKNYKLNNPEKMKSYSQEY